MLNWICIAAGVILLLGGGAAWMALNRRSEPSPKSRQPPPPLPQGRGSPSRPAARRQPGGSRPSLAAPTNVRPARPARREEPINHRNTRAARPVQPEPAARQTLPVVGAGPRGIRPDQFPCCPIDRARNLPGQPQKIFWNDGAGCYRCPNGHRIAPNGRPIL